MSGSQFHFPKKGFTQVSYTTPGAQSFVVPAGVNNLSIVAVGGGGAGATGAPPATGGGRGGGGARTVSTVLNVTPGETLTLNIGAGGIGNTLGGFAPDGGVTTILYSGGTIYAAGGEGAGSGNTGGGVGSDFSTTVSTLNSGGQGAANLIRTVAAGNRSNYALGGVVFAGTDDGGGGGAALGAGGSGGRTTVGPAGGNGTLGGGGGGGSSTHTKGGNGGNGAVFIYYKSDF